MSTIKKKVEFPNQIDVEAIEREIPRDEEGNPTDNIEAEKNGVALTGAGVKAAAGVIAPNAFSPTVPDNIDLTSANNTDPRALENWSTAPCEAANIAMTPDKEGQWQQMTAVAATLENPKGMGIGKVPMETRKQLAEIAEAMKDLPTPDAMTYSDGRKRLIPSEVRDTPNKLDKKKSMVLLEKIIGKPLTAKGVICARSHGQIFFQKPALWLAQALAYELSKRNFYDKVQEIKDYNPELDANNEAVAPQALAKLFSWHVVEELQMLAKIRNISLIHAAKIMVQKVCEVSDSEKAPKDFAEQYDDATSLEQLMAS